MDLGALLQSGDGWPHHGLSYAEVPVTSALQFGSVHHPSLQLPVSERVPALSPNVPVCPAAAVRADEPRGSDAGDACSDPATAHGDCESDDEQSRWFRLILHQFDAAVFHSVRRKLGPVRVGAGVERSIQQVNADLLSNDV